MSQKKTTSMKTSRKSRQEKTGTTDVKPYSFDYSELTKDVATIIESNYTDVNFTIFETRQFNEFMNIQIGKNTIMVSVKSGLENYIFQDLSQAYPGKVLLKPDKETLKIKIYLFFCYILANSNLKLALSANPF